MIRRAILIAALILAIRLPFLNQAIQGDDPYYLAGAEHAQIEPLHPNHVKYLFMGDMVDMRGHPHPPLNSWILGGLLAAVGDIREKPFHLAYISFSLIAALAMLSLAERFSTRPMLATLLFCAVPAFVINGNSFEADLPFLAFWMLAVALFVRGVDSNSTLLLIGSGLSAAVAALGAYQAVFLTPILAVYLITSKARRVFAWLVTLAAPATLAGWQLWERMSSGALPATVLAGYMSTYGLEAFTNKARGAAALVVHLGWMVCPLALLSLMPKSRAWQYGLSILAALAAAAYDHNPLFWITFGCGAWVLAWCWNKGFLGWWLTIFFAGALVVFFAGSARYLLPIAAPLCILIANETRPAFAAAGFALGMALALALSYVNYQHWDGYRQFARSLSKEAGERRVWANAEWGLRYYLESEGAVPLGRNQQVQAEEMVAASSLALPLTVGGTARLRQMEIRPSLPFRLISLSGRSAYSTAGRGLLPFEVSRDPLDWVYVDVAAEPKLSFLDPHDPNAASQVVGGLFPDGWTGKQAVVVLKSKPGAARIVASFFIPPNAPARRVRLDTGEGSSAERTFPGPGAYEMSLGVGAGSGSVTTRIEVDRTFKAPPDTRELGIVLTGVGFR